MDKVFMLSGGAGRVLTALPALKKFKRDNPNGDFKIITQGWDLLFFGEKDLLPHVVPINTKDLFEIYIKPRELIVPEPYFMHDYYTQKISLVEAFNILINNSHDHGLLEEDYYHVLDIEKSVAKSCIQDMVRHSQKQQFIVYQPFGSTSIPHHQGVIDKSSRALTLEKALVLGEALSKHFTVMYFGPPELFPGDHPTIFRMQATPQMNTDLRFYGAMIEQAHAFVGVDSVGQHFARALKKKGFLLMGATFEKNVSYSNYKNFTFFRRKDFSPKYSPLRINDMDCQLADFHNDGIMNFTEKELLKIVDQIKQVI